MNAFNNIIIVNNHTHTYMFLVTESNFWPVTTERKLDYTEPVSSVHGQA